MNPKKSKNNEGDKNTSGNSTVKVFDHSLALVNLSKQNKWQKSDLTMESAAEGLRKVVENTAFSGKTKFLNLDFLKKFAVIMEKIDTGAGCHGGELAWMVAYMGYTSSGKFMEISLFFHVGEHDEAFTDDDTFSVCISDIGTIKFYYGDYNGVVTYDRYDQIDGEFFQGLEEFRNYFINRQK